MPNKGGLELVKSLDHGIPDHQHVRSISSSYPSEAGGARSPELTVSPPMTLGRRILSSLEAYGFPNPHLGFLQSSSGSSERVVGGPGQDTGVKRIGVEGVGGEELDSSQTNPPSPLSEISDIPIPERSPLRAREIPTESPPIPIHVDADEDVEPPSVPIDIGADEGADPNPASLSTIRRHPLPSSSTSTSLSSSNKENTNISTECLPRVSTNPDRGAFALDSDSDGDFSPFQSARGGGGYYDTKPPFPRRAVSGLKRRISKLHLRPKVKKWFVRQFRASRKGSRVIVTKVRERRGKVTGADRSAGAAGTGGEGNGVGSGKMRGVGDAFKRRVKRGAAARAKAKANNNGAAKRRADRSVRVLGAAGLLSIFKVASIGKGGQGR
ncbi:hypothetical protein B0H67DRAFT_246576 [Lasiosphaeris hirsuta]|uniref:Uncharacterized protein n=1 Tax=Lasiosphaeris hirsuta TaxID=260670 RepID=A0AA40AGZ0_9PEZI|nr:hypothetical protein B0H67DRAFT_246576 [Lasiosphaeris hirsuta]